MLDTITFDQLPQAVSKILDELAEIKSMCKDILEMGVNKDPYLTLLLRNSALTIPTIHRIKQSVVGNVSVTSLSTKTTKPVA